MTDDQACPDCDRPRADIQYSREPDAPGAALRWASPGGAARREAIVGDGRGPGMELDRAAALAGLTIED